MEQNSKTSVISKLSQTLQFPKFVYPVHKYGTGSLKLDLERKEIALCSMTLGKTNL